MNNIIKLPRTNASLMLEAQDHLCAEMRMRLASACGSLQGKPSAKDICDVLDRIRETAELAGELAGIWKACDYNGERK